MSGITTYDRPNMRKRVIAGDLPGWLQRHRRKAYIVHYVLSIPAWADRKALAGIEEHAAVMTLRTGIPHEVDHDIPLTHRLVCGLTVPNNLVVMPRAKNGRKGNAWSEGECEQWALFPTHQVEQYELRL